EANTVLPTVHAEIRPRRGELLVAWEAPADGQAQRRPRPLEQVIHLRDEPARVAELEGEALGRIGLQRRDEALQSLQIAAPLGRELEQDRPQGVFQPAGALHQPRQRFLRVLQLFHMGEVAAALDREEEPGWYLLAPARERRPLRQLVVGEVDLYAGEVGVVERQQLVARQAERVEDAHPVRVDPARGADPQPGHTASVAVGGRDCAALVASSAHGTMVAGRAASAQRPAGLGRGSGAAGLGWARGAREPTFFRSKLVGSTSGGGEAG